MKKLSIFAGVIVTGMLLSCGLNAFGQQTEPATTAPATPEVKLTRVSPKGEPPPGAPTFSFVSSEFVYDARQIKGSPYSAEAVTETTQILADGNRIVNRSTASLYRDSEGRTRREQTLIAISGVASGAQPLRTIMISDPVAGVSYSLDPANRTARKTSVGGFTFATNAGPNGPSTIVPTFIYGGSGSEGGTTRTGVEIGVSGGGRAALPSTKPAFVSRSGAAENIKKEDLGTQTIEGVSATGTRITSTIPAGQIGNDRPIEIIQERWFSEDLQAFVMTRHFDPRSGESVYRLSNINRGEPDHSLFEVPADYQIKDTPPVRIRNPE